MSAFQWEGLALGVMAAFIYGGIGSVLGYWWAKRSEKYRLAAAWLKGIKDRPAVEDAIAKYRGRSAKRNEVAK